MNAYPNKFKKACVVEILLAPAGKKLTPKMYAIQRRRTRAQWTSIPHTNKSHPAHRSPHV